MEFLTVSQAAVKLGINRRRVALLCKDGRIKTQTVKGKLRPAMYLLDAASVEEYGKNPMRNRAPHAANGGRPPGKQHKKTRQGKKEKGDSAFAPQNE